MNNAGRMTATARRDIGAQSSRPSGKRAPGICVQMCDDVRPWDDDLDWEFVWFRTLGHSAAKLAGGLNGKKRQTKI